MGGAGSAVLEALAEARIEMPVLTLGLPDNFIEHGDPAKLLALCGLDAAGIEQSMQRRFGDHAPALVVAAWPAPAGGMKPLHADVDAAAPWRHRVHDQPDRRPAHPRHAVGARRAQARDPARRHPRRALSAAAADRAARSCRRSPSGSLDVALPAEQKGTHMSRFVAWLDSLDEPLDAATLRARDRAHARRCSSADEGRVEARFPFFLRKRAPVSGVESLLEYQGRLIARGRAAGVGTIWAEVVVPVKSLCPCSKEISDYGAHNQRSHVTIRRRAAGGRSPGASWCASPRTRRRARSGRAQARRREVDHRARLREPEVRRGHGARRRAAR